MFHKHDNLTIKKLYRTEVSKALFNSIVLYDLVICKKCGRVDILNRSKIDYSKQSSLNDDLTSMSRNPFYEEYNSFVSRIYSTEELQEGIKMNKKLKPQEKIKDIVDDLNNIDLDK